MNVITLGVYLGVPQRTTTEKGTDKAAAQFGLKIAKGDKSNWLKGTAIAWGNVAASMPATAGNYLVQGELDIDKDPQTKAKILTLTVRHVEPIGAAINTVCLVGRRGRDADLQYFESGKCKVSASLAVDKRRRDDKDPSWFDIEIWNKSAETFANYARKGSQISVVGYLTADFWLDKQDGSERCKPIVKVNRWEFVGSKADAEAQQHREPAMAMAGADPDFDAIPF